MSNLVSSRIISALNIVGQSVFGDFGEWGDAEEGHDMMEDGEGETNGEECSIVQGETGFRSETECNEGIALTEACEQGDH